MMTFEFILFYGWLNLAFLISKKKEEVINLNGLLEREAAEIFEYTENNDGY